ncbi:glycerate kinase [Flagellimonas zhangzhouensis]|uniref:Glycerate kinase n=1 Tax=Flagellimonas zhangzhouensis TaxID=1073328 RepID=A0A1H2U428_9FLAO|nr:glycerate kinase [Allomuricauda zhangzhouensis]SDQ20428.1 glycerate kinase [Allomuricauda zhangzhouensis]SDW50945.1 glycerate kinase [Allomuricauda zhangzhouensis]
MKFILSPDKYKGSLSGREFCETVARSLQKVFPEGEIVSRPLADGGDGTIDVVKDYLNASVVSTKVKDPFFREISAPYLLSADQQTAFIEMSEASGYKLLDKSEMNCMRSTTYGTGEMIVDALEKGAKHIVLGIGGSATNDGGMGTAAALGFEFLDKEGQILEPIGRHLAHVSEIKADKVHPKLKEAKIEVACDVNNPFYGNQGAAHVYGPQKGASEEEVAFLDKGLEHFAQILNSTFNIDVQQIQGAGAAGGLGGGAVVFLNAELVSGVDMVMEMAQFEQVLEGADWVITGEGQLDGQTLSGKTINGVIQSAKQKQIPVAAFCGSVDVTMEQMEAMGLDYAVSILNQIGNLEDAKAKTVQNLELAAYNFARLLKQSMA